MIFDARSIDVILSGTRTWQIRTDKVSFKGELEIVQGCSDLIMGQVEVIGCVGPLTPKLIEENFEKFNFTSTEASYLSKKAEKENLFAMILQSPKRYLSPIPALKLRA